MSPSVIEYILKTRIAVYKTGIKAGFWKDIDQAGTSDMMNYLFVKSGNIALYHLILVQMHNEHRSLPCGAYSLFKLPPQVEKEILNYLKTSKVNLLSMVDDANDFLKELNTIATDYCLGDVCIGSFSINDIDNILRLCSSHYLYSFENKVKSFPYFE